MALTRRTKGSSSSSESERIPREEKGKNREDRDEASEVEDDLLEDDSESDSDYVESDSGHSSSSSEIPFEYVIHHEDNKSDVIEIKPSSKKTDKKRRRKRSERCSEKKHRKRREKSSGFREVMSSVSRARRDKTVSRSERQKAPTSVRFTRDGNVPHGMKFMVNDK